MARSSRNKQFKSKSGAWGKSSRPLVLFANKTENFPFGSIKKVGFMLIHTIQSLIHLRTKIITRVLILDMLSTIAEGVALFTFVFLLKRIYDLTDLFAGGTTLLVTCQLLFCLLPSIMVLTFPMALLLSSMMVYGRMAHDNELTALQAGGYSSRQLLMPVVIVGILLTGVLLWWSDRIAPKGLRMFQAIASDVVQKTATTGIRPSSFNKIGNFTFCPSEIENGKMRNIRIFEHKEDTDHKQIIAGVISAPSGQLEYFPTKNTLQLHLENGALIQLPAADRDVAMTFKEMNFSVEINGLLDRLTKTKGGSPEQRFSADMLKSESSIRRVVYENQKKKAEQVEQEQQRYSADTLKAEEGKRLVVEQNQIKKGYFKQWKQIEVEKVNRIALPFACFFMAMIGSLLGMGSKFGKRSSCYSMTILVIFIYYVLLIFGKTFAENGTLPVWMGLWIPNAGSMTLITWLYYRTLRA